VSFNPELPLVISETPGFGSSRSVDKTDFAELGIQRATVTVQVEDDKPQSHMSIHVFTKYLIKGAIQPTVNAIIIPDTADPNPSWATAEMIEWELIGPNVGTYSFSVDIEVNPPPGVKARFIPGVEVFDHRYVEPLPGMPAKSTSITFENIEVTSEGGTVGNISISCSDEVEWTGAKHFYRCVGYDLIATLPSPSIPVGGVWVPVNKFELLAPWISLALLMAVAVASVIYVKHRKKQRN
jgi:hypothetical protein